jgi:hypothetical protein
MQKAVATEKKDKLCLLPTVPLPQRDTILFKITVLYLDINS